MPITKSKLISLYSNSCCSAKEIAHLLNCSENQVWYWIHKCNIPVRSRSDANYIKYNPNGDPFIIKNNLSLAENKLLYLAIGLFWGEGNKRSTYGVRIGNSDPVLLQHWCQFLREICSVQESKIHFYLQTFRDNDIVVAKNYWARELNIDPVRINTGTPTKPLGKGTYKKLSQYGVMTVGVFNTHFRAWMMEQLCKLGYNPE